MENKEIIKERLLKKGYSILNEYDDPPNEIFPDHDHPGDQLLIVIRGLIEITMNGKTTVLNSGDEMFFPKKVVHSAKVGPKGCLYLDGERPAAGY